MTMDEFDRRMQSLRRSLQDRIGAPSPAEIAARARRRRTQRAAQYTVVGLVAVLAVIVPVLTMANGRQGVRPASPGPDSVPSTVTVPTTVPTTVTVTGTQASTQTDLGTPTAGGTGGLPVDGATVYDADFRDPFHVYALVGIPSADGAETVLYATADRGRTWTAHPTPLPTVTGDDGYSADLVMLGQDQVLVRQPITAAAPDWGFRSWYSADAGRSWTPVHATAGGQADPIDLIPADAVLTTKCIVADSQHNDRCAAWNLAAIQPDSGKLAVLSHQPDLDLLGASRIEPAADGRWWVAGTVDGAPAVAVSLAGRTWAVHRLPVTGKPIAIEVVASGPQVWAVVRGSTDTEKNALLGVAYSADAGATWKLTYAPSLGTAPRSFVGAPVPNVPSPGVIVSTDVPAEDMSYLVLNDGTTLAAARPAPGWIRWTGTGYVSTDDNTVYTSSDGLTFMPLTPLG
jgi:hypothetical protein